MGSNVLLPQQHQGHALALELLVDGRVVGRNVPDGRGSHRSQVRQQRVLRQRQQLGRVEPGGLGEATYLATTPLETAKARAICWWDRPASNFSRYSSRILGDDRDRSFRHRDRRFRAAQKPLTIDRSDRSRPAGIACHDPSESALTIRRNTR